MPTLYVTDLDGTLLRGDQRTSAYTNRAVRALIERGMRFSYATARSWNTARKATEGLEAAFPLILYNGAFIRDNATGAVLQASFFAPEEADRLAETLLGRGVQPIVYAWIDGAERFSYLREGVNRPTREFIATRKGDPRDRPVDAAARLFDGDRFYFSCIGEEEKLAPLYDRYRDAYHCVYQRDLYSGETWLEIMPAAATKARAARRLADMLGCDRLVAFGDGANDVDLFAAADESWAVANAAPECKAAATGVIGSNEEDAVARWLEEHFAPD